jgi:hypothetical protein
VVVQFIENDIDRPVIIGAVYNGQGEGGIAPTPGGQAAASEGGATLFQPAHDHGPSAQGNVAGGNAPVWHGASADDAGHRNMAAQWGMRSKEFGGSGYNQLLFDDTDAQGRVQLCTTASATELNLGHLIHAADNYRGSLRGQGAELRTDAYGAVRGAAGLLVSSYRIAHDASSRDPAGDNAAGIALMKQAVKLGEVLCQAAVTHETVALAAHLGAVKASSSVLDEKAAPLAAMLTAVSGMVGSDSFDAAQGDAASKNTSPSDGKLPHVTDPVLVIAAKAGLWVTAGQAVQLSNGETITLMSGQDSQFVIGGRMRVHSGQAIGLLAGAVKAAAGDLVITRPRDHFAIAGAHLPVLVHVHVPVHDWQQVVVAAGERGERRRANGHRQLVRRHPGDRGGRRHQRGRNHVGLLVAYPDGRVHWHGGIPVGVQLQEDGPRFFGGALALRTGEAVAQVLRHRIQVGRARMVHDVRVCGRDGAPVLFVAAGPAAPAAHGGRVHAQVRDW